jgi:hypothetical protein
MADPETYFQVKELLQEPFKAPQPEPSLSVKFNLGPESFEHRFPVGSAV